MTRYFAANSLAAFSRTEANIVEDTTSGRFDSAYVANAINIGSATAQIFTANFSATGTLWLRFDYYMTGSWGSNNRPLILYNGETPVFRLERASTSTLQGEYWNGSAYVATGSAFTAGANALTTIVVRVDLNSGFEVFVGGTPVASGSGWTGGQTAATRLMFQRGGATTLFISQVMVADYDIRDSKFMVPALNGNSAANTGGTGSYTDVGETVLDDSTAVKVTTSGNKQGQTKANITVPAGYIIGAMVLSGRGRVSGSITDGKLGVRTSGGTNNSGSGLSYNGGYEPRQRIIETDPDTGAQFTQTGFNNAEIYEEAV